MVHNAGVEAISNLKRMLFKHFSFQPTGPCFILVTASLAPITFWCLYAMQKTYFPLDCYYWHTLIPTPINTHIPPRISITWWAGRPPKQLTCWREWKLPLVLLWTTFRFIMEDDWRLLLIYPENNKKDNWIQVNHSFEDPRPFSPSILSNISSGKVKNTVKVLFCCVWTSQKEWFWKHIELYSRN